MDAKEARKKAEERLLPINKSSIDAIEKLILESVNNGKFKCDYRYSINVYVRNYFSEKGYTLKDMEYNRNDYYTEISW